MDYIKENQAEYIIINEDKDAANSNYQDNIVDINGEIYHTSNIILQYDDSKIPNKE